MSRPIRKIAINTGGGDAPGLNAVIRAATLAAINRGWEVWGIRSGYRGLIDETPDGLMRLDRNGVRGIAHLGGTILGTTNRGDPFNHPTRVAGSSELVGVDRSDDLVRRFGELGFDALIAIGGDGSMKLAQRLVDKGLRLVVGVPKTIDNDVLGTELTFGFDTAVSIATEALDRLHTTTEAHERVMVVEVMGRHAGWIALHAGMAGGADVLLLPEVPFRFEPIVEKIQLRERRGRRFSIVVAAEGALPVGGEVAVRATSDKFRPVPVLGGIAERVAKEIHARTGKDARSLTLGHLQRGGSPTNFDRLLALRFGAAAVRGLAEGCTHGMVALRGQGIEIIPLEEACAGTKTVPLECDTMRTAREMGLCFGDEPEGLFRSLDRTIPPA